MATSGHPDVAGHRTVGVRFHGRGGQGVVTAAELLSMAAFEEGRHAQAFPSFGSERAGAPVVAFCRLSERPIRTRSPITAPDVLVVQDVTLVHQADVFAGLVDDGYLLVNTGRPLDDLGLDPVLARLRPDRVAAVPATELALAHVGRPVPNAVLLGALSALCGLVGLDALVAAIAARFPAPVAAGNEAAARAAHATVATAGGLRCGADAVTGTAGPVPEEVPGRARPA